VNIGDALCIARAYLAYSLVLISIALLAGAVCARDERSSKIIATMSVLSLVGAIGARYAVAFSTSASPRGITLSARNAS